MLLALPLALVGERAPLKVTALDHADKERAPPTRPLHTQPVAIGRFDLYGSRAMRCRLAWPISHGAANASSFTVDMALFLPSSGTIALAIFKRLFCPRGRKGISKRPVLALNAEVSSTTRFARVM